MTVADHPAETFSRRTRPVVPVLSALPVSRRGPAQPPPVAGAEWEAGRTRDNDRLKVLVGGEPAVGCLAASVRGQWAICLRDCVQGTMAGQGGLRWRHPALSFDQDHPMRYRTAGGFALLVGDVRIVPGDQ